MLSCIHEKRGTGRAQRERRHDVGSSPTDRLSEVAIQTRKHYAAYLSNPRGIEPWDFAEWLILCCTPILEAQETIWKQSVTGVHDAAKRGAEGASANDAHTNPTVGTTAVPSRPKCKIREMLLDSPKKLSKKYKVFNAGSLEYSEWTTLRSSRWDP
jgi:hypothetical protein